MRTSALVMALVLVGTTGRAPVALAQAGAGWVTLFDGKNLDQFVATGDADWHIVDGVLEATKARGFLVSKQSYTDFEMRGDVWATTQSNAGFLFRITNPKDPGIENGYELNINDERKDQSGRTGSIVNVRQAAREIRFRRQVDDGRNQSGRAEDDGAFEWNADGGSDRREVRARTRCAAGGGWTGSVSERSDKRTEVERRLQPARISASLEVLAGTPSKIHCGRSSR